MNIEKFTTPRLTMEYKFKVNFKPLESYREITVEASNDEEAIKKASQEFLKDQYVYPFGNNIHNKVFTATYEIKGGNVESGLEKTNPEREQRN
jgi:hypothetical protein